jgi:ABC-type nitrate/sulfonate/bicarbonate transport system permease component
MLILCIVVVVVELGVTWLERRLVRWKGSDETVVV